MNNESDKLWVSKYRKHTVADIVLDPSIKSMFEGYIKNKSTIPNIMLVGRAGIGKTSLATAIAKDLDATTLYINASSENGIDTVRTKIVDFSHASSMAGTLKIVILDEADGLTADAQKALREVIEASSDDTRYIFTCNYINKIIEPIQSRCTPIYIKFQEGGVLKLLLTIMQQENIAFTQDDGKNIYSNIVKKYWPDIRHMIGSLEQCCVSGKYEYMIVDDSGSNEVVKFIMENKADVKKCRQFWLQHESSFGGDYLSLAKSIFNLLENHKMMKVTADHIYRMNIVIDKEIEFTALVLSLGEIV